MKRRIQLGPEGTTLVGKRQPGVLEELVILSHASHFKTWKESFLTLVLLFGFTSILFNPYKTLEGK